MVRIPDDLEQDLERAVREEGRSEEELILDGVRRRVGSSTPPMPTIPLFRSGDPTLAERVDELLQDFGTR